MTPASHSEKLLPFGLLVLVILRVPRPLRVSKGGYLDRSRRDLRSTSNTRESHAIIDPAAALGAVVAACSRRLD